MNPMEKIAGDLRDVRREASSISPEVLEAVPYENEGGTTRVEIENPEFTSLCPKTGLPDHGTIVVRYLPDRSIVELKSLKYYFMQYRNAGIFYERLTPLILRHLCQVLDPLEMTVEARFTPRGGLSSTVVSTYRRP
ncbi:MAG TPA: preQ(1) synthase [Candidatus Aminicenantes bacterium]|nr:preQ(1) synthase [Candidatus Aminicenantes bacterium]